VISADIEQVKVLRNLNSQAEWSTVEIQSLVFYLLRARIH